MPVVVLTALQTMRTAERESPGFPAAGAWRSFAVAFLGGMDFQLRRPG